MSEREKDMSTMVMDYVRDFMEDVKHDRALQLKTFITVVLSITGFSLFCVEDGAPSNAALSSHTIGWQPDELM